MAMLFPAPDCLQAFRATFNASESPVVQRGAMRKVGV